MNTTTAAAFDAFARILEQHGVRAALAFLVELSDYRFIGIWRFQNGMANAAVHYDKENPGVKRATAVPDDATYCCYVRDSGGAFVTAHAMLDPRTEGHPARSVVLSYHGVPIMDPEGVLLGTLCQYDVVPRDPGGVDLELMLQVASALAQRQLVPPYPTA